MITYIAYANGSNNGLGPADPGVSVYRKVTEGSQVVEEREVASWVVAEISDEDGDLDTLRAEKFLKDSGWRIAGFIWKPASDGQQVIEAEPVAGV